MSQSAEPNAAKEFLASSNISRDMLVQHISQLETDLAAAQAALRKSHSQRYQAASQTHRLSTSSTMPPTADPEQENLQFAVLQREQYLIAIADIQRSLLLVSSDTKAWYDKIMQKLLAVAGASRVYIFESYQASDGQWFVNQKAEACAPGITPELDNPALQNCPLPEISYLGAKYLNNQTVSALVCDLPEPARTHLSQQGIKSVLGIPFQIQRKFAGFVGFDNCVEARVWRLSEIEFLTSATMAIALTLERLQAEQAKRRSETHYRAIFEQSTVGVALVDPQNRILQINQAYCHLLGYAAEALHNRSYTDLIYPEDRAFSLQMLEMVTTPPYPAQTIEKRYVRPDGTVRWVYVYLKSVLSEIDGNVEYVIRTCVDITDQKTAELRLHDINQNLEQLISNRTQALQRSVQEKEVLLKEVHHRVKNNLQVIASLLRIQARRSAQPQLALPLREAENRVKAMALIHEQLYSSSDWSQIHVAHYLEQLVRQVVHTYSHRGQRIRFKVEAADCRLTINSAIPCGLIVTELVANALKHAFPDRQAGQLKICFYQQSNAAPSPQPVTNCLIVQDDGIGFTPQQPNSQSQSLGLIIVQDLVAQLHGELTVSPQSTDPSSGTRFTLRFPSFSEAAKP